MRLKFALLSAAFLGSSFYLAASACDATGITVNFPMMNVAALLAIPAMIAAIAAMLSESN